MEELVSFNIRGGLRRGIRNRFRAACAHRNVDMSQQVIALMEQFAAEVEAELYPER